MTPFPFGKPSHVIATLLINFYLFDFLVKCLQSFEP